MAELIEQLVQAEIRKMAELIKQLVQAEVRRQLQEMLYCQREGCGHIMFEHTPPTAYISASWGYCGHPGCDCYLFDGA